MVLLMNGAYGKMPLDIAPKISERRISSASFCHIFTLNR